MEKQIPKCILNQPIAGPYYWIAGSLVIPNKKLILEMPTFGIHGIEEKNIRGFMDDYEGGSGIGGHFVHMTVKDRSLIPVDFAKKMGSSLSLAFVHSNVNPLVDAEGNLAIEGRPSIILAISRPGHDLKAADKQARLGYSFFHDGDGFVGHTETFEISTNVGKLWSAAKPMVFTDEDLRLTAAEWRKFIEGKPKKDLGSTAIAFTMAMIERTFAIRILDELYRETELRKQRPDLPKPK